MDELKVEIKNLKGISSCSINLPLNKKVNILCGGNGVGKSTILYCIARLFYSQAFNIYLRKAGNANTEIKFSINNNYNKWTKPKNNWSVSYQSDFKETLLLNGFFESSFIFGNRFKYANVGMMKRVEVVPISKMEMLDEYITKKMGYILQDDESYYSNIYVHYPQRKDGDVANTRPVFALKIDDDNIIYHHEMSSGEFIIASLIEYIYDELVRKPRLSTSKRKYHSDIKLILLDEVEIGLHPSAQQRLIIYLKEICKNHDACVFISTHSPSVLSQIENKNIFLLRKSRVGKKIRTITPCGAAYAIKSTRDMNGYDKVILVEDELAKKIIEANIINNDLSPYYLYKIIPVGGWSQVIDMFNEFQESKFGGPFCKYIAILDGDAKGDFDSSGKICNGELKFLPIKSLEKFLIENLLLEEDENIYDRVESALFNSTKKSLDDVIREYISDNPNYKEKDKTGKNFLGALIRNSITKTKTEPEVQRVLCDIAMSYISENQTNNEVLKENLTRFFS